MINKPLTVLKKDLVRSVISPPSGGRVGSYKAFASSLSSGAIIKGDKRRPYPWSYTIFEQSAFQGTASDRQGSYGGNYLNPIYSTFTGPIQGLKEPDLYTRSLASVAYNNALDDLNSKVRGGLDLSVAMAESSSTFRMVRALTKAKRYFSGIGSKRWANEYLELKYGWQPLLSDIYNAAEEVNRVNLGLMYFKGRGSNSKITSEYLGSGGSVDVSGVGNYTQYGVTTKSKINVFNACELKLLLKPPTNLQAAARWTSLNPISIAWELIPYSFVFDWFYDVGSYLRDMETAIAYNSAFSSGYRSELYVASHSSSASYNDNGVNYFTYVVGVNAASKASLKTFSRTILTSYPVPRAPLIRTDLSASRLLSAAALLRQLLK